MARIRMQANAGEESMGGGGGGNFAPAPRDIYTLQIADHSDGEKTSGGKNPGTPITKFVCEIADEGDCFGKKVWHNVTWIPKGKSGHGMAVHFLHAVGMEYDGELDFDEADFQGRSFRALLEVEGYEQVKDGKTYHNEKNVIREVYTENHPEPAELPPPPAPRSRGGHPGLKHAAGEPPTGGPKRTTVEEEIPF